MGLTGLISKNNTILFCVCRAFEDVMKYDGDGNI